MLFAQKMVAPIRLCRGKQGHLGWQCRRGDTELAGSVGAWRDSGVWGDHADLLCLAWGCLVHRDGYRMSLGVGATPRSPTGMGTLLASAGKGP